MKKKEAGKNAAPYNKTRKEDLNRLRGTIEFIDPEKGPTHKGKGLPDKGDGR